MRVMVFLFMGGNNASPEEIVPTEEFTLAGETLVGEWCVTVETSDTVRMPRPLQDIQQELVQDGLVTARARYQHSCCWLAPSWNNQKQLLETKSKIKNYIVANLLLCQKIASM